jgi:hypothetical protein
MPQIFKALATITVWILFVLGCLTLLAGFGRIIGAAADLTPAPSVQLMRAYFGSGIASLILSVVAMKLRQLLE